MISLSKRVLLSLFIFFSALYAIDITNCTNISYSGVYELTTNVSGAPLSTEEFGVAAANCTCIKVASSDVVFDCKGYNITNNATENASGVSINGSTTIAYNNVTIRNCQNISNYTYGLYVYNSTNSIIYNNTFLNNTYGVSLNSFYYGIFEKNTINYSTSQSVALSSYYTNFTNNYLDNGLNSGFTASGDNNRYTNNTIFNHSFRAVQISGDYGVYTYNIIINASVGFYMEQADNNTIENNTITRTFYDGSFPASSGAAIYLTLGGDNNITNNNLTGNLEGVHIDARLSNSLMRNTIYNNSVYGIHLSCPDGNCDNDTISMNSDHLYNNGFDLYINSSHTIGTYIINFTTIVLDNPYGSYENYTNVTIRDFLNSSEETYWINWTSNSSSLPAGTTRSFAQKFINITSYNTSRTIDLITWHWSDAELIFPYNESRFVLYRYNGSWLSVPNQSLDITNNCLNASNLGAFSDFGILQDNSPPNVTQPSILPATAYTNNTLNATTTYSDTDNHTGNVTFVWFLNNSNIYNTTFLTVANNTILTSNLSGTNFSHFDLINVTVYAFDGANYSQNFTSTNTINISNTVPILSAVSLTPTNLYATLTLNASVNYTDLDLDQANVTFIWYVNAANPANTTNSGVTNGTTTSATLSASYFNASDAVNVSVYANDSRNLSITRNASITVLAYPIISINISPSSGYIGDSVSFFANVTNATAVNVSFSTITLNLTNTSATLWNYSNYVIPSITAGTYTATFSAVVDGNSFTNTTNITILGDAPTTTTPSSSESSQSSITLSYATTCPDNNLTVTVSSGANTEVRLLLTEPYEGLVSSVTTNNNRAAFTLSKAGTYQVTALKPGYKLTSLTFSYTVCNVTGENQTTIPPIIPPLSNVTVQANDTNVTPPITPPADQIKINAESAISAVESAISAAKAAGKDTTTAESKLAEAKTQYNAGDYTKAKQLADEALTLAQNAQIAPTILPTTTTITTPDTKPKSDSGLSTVLGNTSLIILLIVLLVLTALIYLVLRRKK